MSEAQDGTGAGLLAFLDWAGSRGEIARPTAQAIAVTTRKVLDIEPDPDTVDLKRLDPEDLFARFETLNRMSYTSESIKTYRSRFFRGYSMYMAWLDKRPDWKSASLLSPGKAIAVRSANGKPAPKPRSRRTSPPEPTAANGLPDGVERMEYVASASPMVPYDLPLRPGLRVRLVLPELLTQADAKRIAAFVDSLAFGQAEVGQEGA